MTPRFVVRQFAIWAFCRTRLRRALCRTPLLGAAGTAFGAFAMLCCFGWTGLATFLPAIGLGFLVRFSVALRLVWIALGLTALGLAASFRRHRRPLPLLTAALGAALVLYPMYHALEVPLWLGLLYGGLGTLFGASVLDARLARRCCRNRALPADLSAEG